MPSPKAISETNPEFALYRGIIPFTNPNIYDGNVWRTITRSQPIAMLCITTLTMHIQSLPNDIRAIDSDQADDLKEDILYYKKKLKKCQDNSGFLNFVDYVFQDFYMTPFGAGVESVRYSDGKLYSFRALDSATLYLNNNILQPYFQYVPEANVTSPIYFKQDELVRMFQSPRAELQRRGWQMPPVEKVYLALEMLNRGDKYYANLLLDTPEAGILDLGDMARGSAEAWIESFRAMFAGPDAFKIPVLFEHTSEAKYIPFNRPPTDMLFDTVTLKYAAIMAAAFGLTLGDIGIKATGGGGALSGQIRDERHSKSTGFASAKSHFKELMDSLLPEELEFVFIDVDDELLVSKGRARSANAVAMRNLAESGFLTPTEGRAQLKADGLISIPLAEQADNSEFDIIKEINGTADQIRLQEEGLKLQKQTANQKVATPGGQAGKNLNKRRNVRGGKLESVQGKENVPASSGGQGEVKSLIEKSDTTDLASVIGDEFSKLKERATDVRIRRLLKMAFKQKADFDGEVILRGLVNDQDELVTKAVADLKDELQKETWFHVDFDETEIGDLLLESYADGLRKAAEEVYQWLYEEGKIDDFSLSADFVVHNRSIADGFYTRAGELNRLINDGTALFMSRMALAVVAQSENQDNLDLLVSMFLALYDENLTNRTQTISDFETRRAYNEGILKQFSEMGLSRKSVIGKNEPCEVCQHNISLGFVALDYLYPNKFGGTSQTPEFHPECECSLTFDKEEVKAFSTKPTFYTGD